MDEKVKYVNPLTKRILDEIDRIAQGNLEKERYLTRGAYIAMHEFNNGGKNEQTTFRCHNHTRNLANRIADRDERREGSS